MKSARTSLAFASGLLLALGYVSAAEPDGWTVMRIMIGLMFGVCMATSMILWPERITRRLTCFAAAPLVAAFIVAHMARMETRPEVIVTVIAGLAFLGIQFAFASLSTDRSG